MVEGRRDKADDAYSKIAALLKYQYTLTYTPDTADTVTHHLSLNTKKERHLGDRPAGLTRHLCS